MKISRHLIRQMFLYGIIGGCGAFVDVLLFIVLFSMILMNEFIANIISVHCGIALSFCLNRKYNFNKTDRIIFRAFSFYLTGLFGLALSSVLLAFGNFWELHVNIVKIASVFVVAVVQFIINKLIAFGN